MDAVALELPQRRYGALRDVVPRVLGFVGVCEAHFPMSSTAEVRIEDPVWRNPVAGVAGAGGEIE